jgi:hypothetical protein
LVKVDQDILDPANTATITFAIVGEKLVDDELVQCSETSELDGFGCSVRTYRAADAAKSHAWYMGEHYGELVYVDMRELATKLKAVRAVDRKLRKMIEAEKPESAAQLVSIFARAVKAKAVWQEIGRKPNNRRIMERNPDVYSFATRIIEEHTATRKEAVA